MKSQEIKEKYPDRSFGEILITRIFEYPILDGVKDSWGCPVRNYSKNIEVEDQGWRTYLGHSCDEWVIGNLESAIEFRDNLSEAIEFMHQNP